MKKIAIIGGSYLQLPVVKKAKSMGVEVHVFSWEKGAVCKEYADYFYPISIIEKEQILSKCQEIGIDGITTIASDTAVVTVNYVASKMGLVSNPDEYTLETTNKGFMRKCFWDNYIPSPKFVVFKQGDNLKFEDFQLPLIVKPTDRSGSLGVQKVERYEDVRLAIEKSLDSSFSKSAIIEEFIPGREVSVEAISFQGHHNLLQITDKVTTGAPYFVELEHHQPSSFSESVKERIKCVVLKALDALHIQYGATHSELKITEKEDIYVIEIGARMGGDFIGSDLVQLSTGYDFLRGVVEVALGDFTPPIIKEDNNSGVYFLSEETPYVVKYINNSSLFPEIVSSEITDSELHELRCSGDRSGYFIYQSNQKFQITKN